MTQDDRRGERPSGERLDVSAVRDTIEKVIAMADADVFKQPDGAAILWRYMSFAKFVSLLETGSLYFASAASFGDRFEGSYTQADVSRVKQVAQEAPPEIREELLDLLSIPFSFSQELRRSTYISCWTESDHESAALWKLYVSDSYGVVVRTTFESLISSMDRKVRAGRVTYVDYVHELIRRDHPLRPFMRKRKHFEFEHEVRALFTVAPKPEVLPDSGVGVAVDLDRMLSEVRVSPAAPDWFLGLASTIVKRYGFRAPVVRSEFDVVSPPAPSDLIERGRWFLDDVKQAIAKRQGDQTSD